MSAPREGLPRLTIVGTGPIATTLAQVLGQAGPVTLCTDRPVDAHVIPSDVKLEHTLQAACLGAEMLVLAVPLAKLRHVARELGQYTTADQVIIHTARGVEPGFVLPHAILRAETCVRQIAVLNGPHAGKDLARGKPVATILASRFPAPFLAAQAWLAGMPVMLHKSCDIIGVEVANAFAGVVSLAVGMAHGLDLGESVRGVLFGHGLTEAARLGCALGAEAETFTTLAGVSELMPASSPLGMQHLSRGEEIVKVGVHDAALSAVLPQLQGVVTCYEAQARGAALGLELPLMTAVRNVLTGQSTPAVALESVLDLGLDFGRVLARLEMRP